MSTRTAISHRPSLHTPFASPIPRTRPIHIPPPTATPSDGDDLVTRWVGRLFGQKVLEDPEPGGLKRLTDEALQELYPAPLDEFADPVVRMITRVYRCCCTTMC